VNRRLGAVLGWTAAAVLVVLGVLAVWAAGRESAVGEHYRSPDDSSPDGAMAVAEVLRDQGVDVTVTRSFWETEAAVGGGDDLTLLVDDDWWVLTPEAHEQVLALSRDLVLVQPTDEALDSLAPGVTYGGFAGGVVDADCELPAAERAGRIEAGGDAYLAPADAVRCFPAEGDAYSVVRIERGSRTITVLGAGDILSNGAVTGQGNAALALGLLGEHPRLVWYQPDVDDYAFESDGSLASRQADWYLPLVVLLLLVGVAAALWRGRRMGPVVVEDLPVEVRSSETMEGRARLYERSGSRDHALGTLRAATVTRLSRILGLSRTATIDEVVNACAAITGRDPVALDALLRSAPARDDREFVRLSDDLLWLEHDLARDLTPR
jgi:hypothetical protein